MLNDLKKKLMEDPDLLIQILEHYEFTSIRKHTNYISCARESGASAKSITIWLENNDNIYVKDWARNFYGDIFVFLKETRGEDFSSVLNVIKSILDIADSSFESSSHSLWGGYFESFQRETKDVSIKIYSESELDRYGHITNLRFLKDHIDLSTQLEFGIGYDDQSAIITIPIRNQFGDLIGIKGRKNYDSKEEGFNKYIYLLPCVASQTLFGYCKNYSNIENGTILIGEAEKFVMQCWSYGYKNAVSIGSGTLSTKQIQMILECHPKEIILCHDVGYGLTEAEDDSKDPVLRNLKMLSVYSRFIETDIKFWDWRQSSLKNKSSITDFGKDVFESELTNHVYDYG